MTLVSKFLELFVQKTPFERTLDLINGSEKIALPSGLDVNVLEDKFLLVGDNKLSENKLVVMFDNLDKNVVVKRYGEVIFMSEDEEEIAEIRNYLFDLHNRMKITENNANKLSL